MMKAELSRARRPRDLLVCLSHLRWNFVFQRPQHLMTKAAAVFDVIFVEEPEFETIPTAYLRLMSRDGVLVVTPILPKGETDPETVVAVHLRRLLDSFEASRRVVWYYTPMALPLAREIDADCIVYDCMDELSAFRNPPPNLGQREEQLLATCDVVFTGGRSLYEAKCLRHPSVHCFPSSVDVSHFGKARAAGRSEPPDMANIPGPRIGFFGVIDERCDIDLIEGLAALRPDWHFVLIGPTAKIDPSALPQAANLHWLGMKSYAELPACLGALDIGFMPFADNESTRFISPTKTPEFLAAGLPVVSTPIRDVVRDYGEDGLVEIASGVEETHAAIVRLLERPREHWLAQVDARLATLSWDATWQAMHALLRPFLTEGVVPEDIESRQVQFSGVSHV